jgi:hypothetical protein
MVEAVLKIVSAKIFPNMVFYALMKFVIVQVYHIIHHINAVRMRKETKNL